MNRHITSAALALLVAASATASAQDVIWTHSDQQVDHLAFAPAAAQRFEMVSAEPLERIPPVKNAPFSAEAINEFTQVLADGNRIERRYSTSLWRDGQGRTRREQEIALVGRLNVNGEPPKMITIEDPVGRVSYTLDAETRTARSMTAIRIETHRTTDTGVVVSGARAGATGIGARGAGARGAGASADFILNGPPAMIATAPALTIAAGAVGTPKVEPLGTRTIEGVEAEGTRTTTTIPAGAIGNVAAIEIVTERWFSKELQTAVMITRRDPQAGDTVYRLTNIVRAEPQADLFVVPSDYTKR